MPSVSEYERLFVLEFFVDYVTIQNGSFDNTQSKLCISFQFLHYPVMRVCEEDFNPQFGNVSDDSKVVFKRGKSCLFSIHPDENNKISSNFNLVVAVCQKFNDCNARSLIGQAPVNLGESFTNLLLATSDGQESIVKHDLFPLKDKFKRVVGSVAAFARLSNYGKMIITQFQLASEGDMNYMFKGTDQRKLFKNDPMMNFPIIDRPKRVSEQKDSAPPPCNKGPCVVRAPKHGDTLDESSEDESSSEESDESEQISEYVQTNIGDSDIKDEDDYNEIEAEINGHSITIHVARKKKKTEDLDPCCPPCCPDGPDFPPMPPCCLSQYQPSQNTSIQEEFSQGVPNGDQLLTNEEITEGDPLPVCPLEDCPLGLYNAGPPADPMDLEAGVVALKGDHVFFQMANRPAGEDVNEKERKSCSNVYYTVGATQAGKETLRNYVQISPQSPLGHLIEDEPPEGPVSGLPIDNKQDMFLFKVLKENNQINARCQLEMELRTPKEPYPKPDTNTIDAQCIEADFPPVEKKGKKGGKGDKKKGKKK